MVLIDKPGRSQATLNRIARGRAQLKTDTFLIPYYGSGSGLTGRSFEQTDWHHYDTSSLGRHPRRLYANVNGG